MLDGPGNQNSVSSQIVVLNKHCRQEKVPYLEICINFNTDKPNNKETIPGTKVYLPERAKRYVLDEDEELIIDERGVRLARSEPEDGD